MNSFITSLEAIPSMKITTMDTGSAKSRVYSRKITSPLSPNRFLRYLTLSSNRSLRKGPSAFCFCLAFSFSLLSSCSFLGWRKYLLNFKPVPPSHFYGISPNVNFSLIKFIDQTTQSLGSNDVATFRTDRPIRRSALSRLRLQLLHNGLGNPDIQNFPP